MISRGGSVFAGGGIWLSGVRGIVLTMVVAFGLGVAVGWGTWALPGLLLAEDPLPTPSPTTSLSDAGDVLVPALEPIFRDLDDADALAGVTTTQFTYRGAGSFTTLAGKDSPSEQGAPVRWVSIGIEDGIQADVNAFGSFVMSVLGDNRSWGSDGRLRFARTDGVADYRILLASPYTAAAICPEAHVAVEVGPVSEVTATPSPEAKQEQATFSAGASPGASAGATPSPAASVACANDGMVVVSVYDWTAGFKAFGADRTAARQYIVNHQLGHLFGESEGECTGGVAKVMDNQRGEMPDCTPNPWPFPDASTTATTPAPSGGGGP